MAVGQDPSGDMGLFLNPFCLPLLTMQLLGGGLVGGTRETKRVQIMMISIELPLTNFSDIQTPYKAICGALLH